MMRSLQSVVRQLRKLYKDTSDSTRRAGASLRPELLEDRLLTSYVPAGTPAELVPSFLGGESVSSSRTLAEFTNGTYRVVWEDGGVYTQSYLSNGTPMSSVQMVDANPGDSQATIAVNGNGTYVIAWTAPFGTDNEFTAVAIACYKSSSALACPVFVLGENGGSNSVSQPSVALDGMDNFVVAATDRYTNGVSTIDLYRGNALSGTLAPLALSSGHAAADPSVAMNPNGQCVVTWAAGNAKGGEDVLAQRFSAAGKPQGARITVNAGSNPAMQPSVAMDYAGDFVVAYAAVTSPWPGALPNDEVCAALFHANGKRVGATITVAGDANHYAYTPSAAMDHSGNFVIGYTAGSGYAGPWSSGVTTVQANAYNAKGVLQQSGINLAAGMPAPGASWSYDLPSVALGYDGNLTAVWESHTNLTVGDYDLYLTGAYTQTFKNISLVWKPGAALPW
jgi:hypothetical protein